MKIVQVIGRPCTGKSTFLRRFCKEEGHYLLDIANYRDNLDDFLLAENKLLKDLINNDKYYVCFIESASGFYDLNSRNIKFCCDNKVLEKNHKARHEKCTDDVLEYYSLLESLDIACSKIIDITIEKSYEDIRREFIQALEGYL